MLRFFLKKCHFVYSSIKTFDHHVFRLGLCTLEKKIQVIKNLKFSRTFRELKIGLGFFDYYRKFVEWYVTIEKFLLKLKTKDFKNDFAKSQIRLKWTNKIFLQKKAIKNKSKTKKRNRNRTNIFNWKKETKKQFQMKTNLENIRDRRKIRDHHFDFRFKFWNPTKNVSEREKHWKKHWSRFQFSFFSIFLDLLCHGNSQEYLRVFV